VITVVHFVAGNVSFKRLKRLYPSLMEFIEPDFGLLDELRGRKVLTTPEVEVVRAEKAVSKQNEILLSCLKHKSPEQRQRFLVALDSTGQQHVANWIEQSTGKSSISRRCVLHLVCHNSFLMLSAGGFLEL